MYDSLDTVKEIDIFSSSSLNVPSGNDLIIEDAVNLMKEKEGGHLIKN